MNPPVRFSFATLPVSHWRNGGGETRQIVSWPLPGHGSAPGVFGAALHDHNSAPDVPVTASHGYHSAQGDHGATSAKYPPAPTGPALAAAGSWPSGADEFAWRASIATIDRDGDFSAFPGVDRIITLLEGDGVTLQGPPAINHPLTRPGAPFAFAGEQPITARLAGGVSRDFNIMTRRRGWRATVTPQQCEFHLPAGHSGVVYIMAGHWSLVEDNSPALAEREGLWWHELTASRRLAPQGDGCLALWADIVAC